MQTDVSALYLYRYSNDTFFPDNNLKEAIYHIGAQYDHLQQELIKCEKIQQQLKGITNQENIILLINGTIKKSPQIGFLRDKNKEKAAAAFFGIDAKKITVSQANKVNEDKLAALKSRIEDCQKRRQIVEQVLQNRE